MQPDTIIPSPSNPQGWNRYSYVENNPVIYLDTSGHFKCINNSTTFTGDCHDVIESYLDLLWEKGGEEGRALVEAFRSADTVDYGCRRGGCIKYEDQITITIEDDLGEDVVASYQTTITGNHNYSLTADMMNATGDAQLVAAGSFGHEIHHQTQGWFKMGTILSELDAYETQSTLYKNMGIGSSDNSNVLISNDIAGYKYKSEEEIMGSAWAKKYGLPFTNIFTPKWDPATYHYNKNRPR